jgi:type VI secretion system protein
MSLSLKIISFKGQPFSAGTEVVFDSNGGTIGRADENTLALPDPEKFVSRRHASILFENGQFLLKDSSLSGTYIDDQEPPLNNATQALVDGMRLRIGEYEILVSMTQEQQADDLAFEPGVFASPFTDSPVAENPSYEPAPFAPVDDIFNTTPQDDPHLDAFLGNTADTSFPTSDSLLHPGPDDQGQPRFDSLTQANIATIHDSYIPPAPFAAAQSANEIPDDFNFEELFNSEPGAPADDHSWFQGFEPEAAEQLPPETAETEPVSGDLLGKLLEPEESVSVESVPDRDFTQDRPAAPVQAPVMQTSTAVQPAGSDELFKVFLQGAGVEEKDLLEQAAPETMRRIGLMFRKLVEGTVAVLRSRAEFKSQFRVSMTTIRTTNNNPLKFAVTTEDALTHLVKNGQGGFKDSVEAIDEGFNDIMSHQMAMQAGIQASLAQILRQFDPKLIEKQFEEGLVLQKKSKCWDKYTSLYPRVVEQAMEDFFGDAFAEAYEKQMKQLSNLRTEK